MFAHALCQKCEEVFLLNVSLVGLFPNTLNSYSAKINLLLDSSLKGDGRRRWVRELLFFFKKKPPTTQKCEVQISSAFTRSVTASSLRAVSKLSE